MLEFVRMAKAERRLENMGKSYVELMEEGCKKAGYHIVNDPKTKNSNKNVVRFEKPFDSSILAELVCRLEPQVMGILKNKTIDQTTIDSYVAYGFFNFIKTYKKEVHNTNEKIVRCILNSVRQKIDQLSRKEEFRYKPGYDGVRMKRARIIESLGNSIKSLGKLVDEEIIEELKASMARIELLNKKLIKSELPDNPEEEEKFYLKNGQTNYSNIRKALKKRIDQEFDYILDLLEPEVILEPLVSQYIKTIKELKVKFANSREKYLNSCQSVSGNDKVDGDEGDGESRELFDFIPDDRPSPEDQAVDNSDTQELLIKYSSSPFGKILLEIIIDCGRSGKVSVGEVRDLAYQTPDFVDLVVEEFGYHTNDRHELVLSLEENKKLFRKIKVFYRGLRDQLMEDFRIEKPIRNKK